MLTILGGVTLLFNKKIGWLTSVVTSAIYAVMWLSVFKLWIFRDLEMEYDTRIVLPYLLLELIFITNVSLLLFKPIRNNYQPTKKTG